MTNDYKPQHQAQNQAPSKGNKPVETLWDGSIKMAIFANQRDNGVTYSTEMGRIYTDHQGQVREAKSFSHTELLKVSKLSDKAYDRIHEFKQSMKKQTCQQDRER